MKQLLEAGVHFGHQTRRWNPKMQRFIFTERNGIHIIDLQQTVTRLDEAVNVRARHRGQRSGDVLIVGTKKQARETVFQEATRAGLPYVNNALARRHADQLPDHSAAASATSMISKIVSSAASSVRRAKKEQLDISNEIARLNRFFGGIKEMERPACGHLHCRHRQGSDRRRRVPTAWASRSSPSWIATVIPTPVTYPIPSNDDAIRAIKLILGKICDAAVEGRAAAESGVGAGVSVDEMVAEGEAEASDGETPAVAEAAPVDAAPAPAATPEPVAEPQATPAPAQTTPTE